MENGQHLSWTHSLGLQRSKCQGVTVWGSKDPDSEKKRDTNEQKPGDRVARRACITRVPIIRQLSHRGALLASMGSTILFDCKH